MTAPRPMLPLEIALQRARWSRSEWLARLALMTAGILAGCSSVTPKAPETAASRPPVVELPAEPEGIPDWVGKSWPCTIGSDEEWGCDPPPAKGDLALPVPAWDLISLRLDRWSQYPPKCQGAIDDCHAGWKRIIKIEARAQVLRGAAAQIEAAGWPAWKVVLTVVGFSTLGVGLGFVAGALAVVAGMIAL